MRDTCERCTTGARSVGCQTFPNGRTMAVCANCANAIEVELMRIHGRAFLYLSSDNAYVTTWLGAPVLKVQSVSKPKRVGFGRRIYVRAFDPTTKEHWTGSGPADSGTYVRVRRVRAPK